MLIALALYAVSGDAEEAEKICQAALRAWSSETTERLGYSGEFNAVKSEIIERCAQTVDDIDGDGSGMIYRKDAVAAIRALRDQP